MKSLPISLFVITLATPVLYAQTGPNPTPDAAPASAATQDAIAPSLAPPTVAASGSVVDAKTLIAILPPAPAGWSADKPEGSTTDSTGFAMTTVSCVYANGTSDTPPTATVNIIDSANNQQFADSTKVMWSATSNGPLGYDKTVTVAGLPGFEHYSNADKTGVLWVVVGGRFFVQIETTQLAATDLEAWLGRIDLKKLSALK